MQYIVGVRLRGTRKVRGLVLSRAGRYQEVVHNLRAEEVWVDGRRYIVCHNPEEEEKDQRDREMLIEGLKEELKSGTPSLTKDPGYRRFLRVNGDEVFLDETKIKEDEQYDAKWVLRTNTSLPADEVVVQYKNLWMVESTFRKTKDLFETRPVFHEWDDTIRSRILSSFLALVLRHELEVRLEHRNEEVNWADVTCDIEALQQAAVSHEGRLYRLRLPLQGVCARVSRAVGAAIPPSVQPA
ncbi:MAG: transposase [Firmicutes bacterium]|jgi:hypothetical protein|nr:transposase [Bacillota bacterium]